MKRYPEIVFFFIVSGAKQTGMIIHSFTAEDDTVGHYKVVHDLSNYLEKHCDCTLVPEQTWRNDPDYQLTSCSFAIIVSPSNCPLNCAVYSQIYQEAIKRKKTHNDIRIILLMFHTMPNSCFPLDIVNDCQRKPLVLTKDSETLYCQIHGLKKLPKNKKKVMNYTKTKEGNSLLADLKGIGEDGESGERDKLLFQSNISTEVKKAPKQIRKLTESQIETNKSQIETNKSRMKTNKCWTETNKSQTETNKSRPETNALQTAPERVSYPGVKDFYNFLDNREESDSETIEQEQVGKPKTSTQTVLNSPGSSKKNKSKLRQRRNQKRVSADIHDSSSFEQYASKDETTEKKVLDSHGMGHEHNNPDLPLKTTENRNQGSRQQFYALANQFEEQGNEPTEFQNDIPLNTYSYHEKTEEGRVCHSPKMAHYPESHGRQFIPCESEKAQNRHPIQRAQFSTDSQDSVSKTPYSFIPPSDYSSDMSYKSPLSQNSYRPENNNSNPDSSMLHRNNLNNAEHPDYYRNQYHLSYPDHHNQQIPPFIDTCPVDPGCIPYPHVIKDPNEPRYISDPSTGYLPPMNREFDYFNDHQTQQYFSEDYQDNCLHHRMPLPFVYDGNVNSDERGLEGIFPLEMLKREFPSLNIHNHHKQQVPLPVYNKQNLKQFRAIDPKHLPDSSNDSSTSDKNSILRAFSVPSDLDYSGASINFDLYLPGASKEELDLDQREDLGSGDFEWFAPLESDYSHITELTEAQIQEEMNLINMNSL